MSSDIHTPNSRFSREIASVMGGEVIEKCIQCGICTASCAVAKASDTYRPRQLIQKILIGKRDEILSSDLPWLCMTCRACEERCQEGVSPADVFRIVRMIAAREGHVPRAFRRATASVLRDGWMLESAYSDFTEDEREDLGLDPNLRWNTAFTRRLKVKYFEGVEYL